MPEWEYIVLCCIPLYCLAYVLLFGLGIQIAYRMRLASKSADTKDWIDEVMGLVVYICGQIGAGKTTMGAAVCNDLSLISQDMANAKIQEVLSDLPDVDFTVIDDVVSKAYFSGLTNSDAIISYLFARNPDLERKFHGYYYDYLYPVTKNSLLKDYIKAKVAMIRNNYVYFNLRKFYCWPTDHFAMAYDPRMLNIKERHEMKDYKGQYYTVFFEDEKILSGTDSMHSSDVAKEDGGKSEFFRTIRHFGRKTIRFVTTCQDFTRDVKAQRELATDIIYIDKREEIPYFSFGYVGYSIAYQFLQVCSGIKYYFDAVRIDQKADGLRKKIKFLDGSGKDSSNEKARLSSLGYDPSLKPSRLRDAVSRVAGKLKKVYSDQFIRYKCSHWLSANDFDSKAVPGKVDLCFPIAFAYGSIDTYGFSFLGDQLSLESIQAQDWYDPNDHSIPPFDPDEMARLTDEILERRDQKRPKASAKPVSSGYDPLS